MSHKVVGLAIGVGFGFILSWAHVTDPGVISDMLLLRGPYVFLLMGSGIVVAAVGVRLLRAAGMRAFVTREPIAWSPVPPGARHVVGSMLFGAGWSVAGTCPGPVAAMIGEGKLGGLVVAAGLTAGVLLQRAVARWRIARPAGADLQGAAGL